MIELLVVITIVMTVLSLLGGAGLRTVEKARAQGELISVYGIIRKASVRAFTSGKPLDVLFVGPSVRIMSSKKRLLEKKFEYLEFDEQFVFLDRNGMSNTLSLTARVNDSERVIDLRELIMTNGRVDLIEGANIENQ